MIWLLSHTDTARLWPLTLQLNTTTPMSPVRLTLQVTQLQRRLWLWLWTVSALLSRGLIFLILLNFTTLRNFCRVGRILFEALQSYDCSFSLLDMREVKITGNRTVEEGDVLNLTCSVDSFPPSKISWSKFQTVTYPEAYTLTDKRNNTATYLQEERGSFSISNVTTEDSGLYVCTAEHLNNTMTEGVNVTVICKYIVLDTFTPVRLSFSRALNFIPLKTHCNTLQIFVMPLKYLSVLVYIF